jgi:predicted  nucleic acid-binding Zn-ribbon protein
MDSAKELEALKQKKDDLVKKIAALSEKKTEVEKQIVDLKSKVTTVDQEIFQRENIVFVEAAKMAAEADPAFAKLVKSFTEKLIFEAEAKQPKQPKKKIGRPRKDAAS